MDLLLDLMDIPHDLYINYSMDRKTKRMRFSCKLDQTMRLLK